MLARRTWDLLGRAAVCCLVCLMLLLVVGSATVHMALPASSDEQHQRMAREQVATSVAGRLFRLGAIDAYVDGDDRQKFKYLVDRIEGINGFSQSDHFHGDGDDWYEARVTSYLGAELRGGLSSLPGIQKVRAPSRSSTQPAWWPQSFRADAECYRKGFTTVILTDGGTRLWMHVIRT